uniref:DNA-directed DNA polymerase n=1 Tax=Echinostoma caproni TaxID=27848 RepID=A0A183B3A9_9TREM
LGLKLMANVIFGYTAASFSGRMPCVEVGDSIVHKSRETLERAIELVHSGKIPFPQSCNARVVYGDTDSLFVHLPGLGRAEAFTAAEAIAKAVTSANPAPIKLRLEKIYYPCLLEAKKRYAGYAYQDASQTGPVFDAKGLETVRRDCSPFVSEVRSVLDLNVTLRLNKFLPTPF